MGDMDHLNGAELRLLIHLQSLYLLKSQKSSESKIETSSEVVSGKKREKFSFSIDRSPGNRPRGILESQGQISPRIIKIAPAMISPRLKSVSQ